jgi:SAM-dependent methyltransferase
MQDVIPNDHARQVNSVYYIEEAMAAPSPPDVVVDLGCGRGRTAAKFRSYQRDVVWIGVDIPDSPESKARVTTGDPVLHYDGVRLPFRDASLPLIYSHQVFEHVRHPSALLLEIARVLKPGGVFIGSTSQLEPYHSFSVWNYTPYGFRLLLEEAALRLEEIRPSLDGVALIMRAFHGRPPEYSRFFVEESPLNVEIDTWAKRTGRRPALANLRKLMFCGQFAFRVRRPPAG